MHKKHNKHRMVPRTVVFEWYIIHFPNFSKVLLFLFGIIRYKMKLFIKCSFCTMFIFLSTEFFPHLYFLLQYVPHFKAQNNDDKYGSNVCTRFKGLGCGYFFATGRILVTLLTKNCVFARGRRQR